MKRMLLFAVFLSFMACRAQVPGENQTAGENQAAGGNRAVGDVHMDVTCSASVAADFDVALALLHNFWYARALDSFREDHQSRPAMRDGLLGGRDDLQPPLLGSANQ